MVNFGQEPNNKFLGTGLVALNNAAVVAPTVNDDSTAGYSVGSYWIDTTGPTWWQCLDATPGAAVWESVHGIVPGGNINVTHITMLPQPGSSGTPSDATANNASYVQRARSLIDFDHYATVGGTLQADMSAIGYVSGGGAPNGDVRVTINGVEFGVINYTETTPTLKSVALSSPMPSTGILEMAIELRRNSGGTTITIEDCSVDLLVVAP